MPDDRAPDDPTPAPVTPPAATDPASGPDPAGGWTADMPRWIPRAIVLAVVAYGMFTIGRWLLGELRGLIILVLVALFLSFAIEPAVDWLSQRGWRRGPATAAVFLTLTLVTGAFTAAIGSVVVSEVDRFVDEAPQYLEDLERWVNDRFEREFDFDELIREFTSDQGAARGFANDLASDAVGLGIAAIGIVFQIFTIALFTFYLVADGPRLRRSICSRLPERQQRRVLQIWELAIRKTGGYLYSRSLLAGLSAAFHGIAFWVIGVPYPLALALWVGVVSQFIPTVGTYLAGGLAVLIAVLHDPVEGIWTLAVVIVYQQIENYLLAPRVTAQTMEIHPAVAFGSVIAGAALLGVPGALLALPAAAVLQAILSTIGERHEVVESTLTTARVRRAPDVRAFGWRRRRDPEVGA